MPQVNHGHSHGLAPVEGTLYLLIIVGFYLVLSQGCPDIAPVVNATVQIKLQ